PVPPPLAADDLVHLHSGAHQRLVPVDQIALIEAQEDYSLVRLTDGTRELVRRTLKRRLTPVPAERFVGLPRPPLNNLHHVTGYRRDGRKKVSLHLAGLRRWVPVGRSRWREVQRRLPGLRREK